MIRLVIAAVLSTGLAAQAQALSCLRPSVQGSFAQANAAEADYVLAVGRLQLLPGETLPEADADPNARTGYSVRTRFDGRLAAADGFTEAASFPVTVEVQCDGPWCGGMPLDRVLVFIERREGENVLVEGLCPMFALAATPEVVEGALSCLRGEDCTPPE